MYLQSHPLSPRRGNTLVVLAVLRVSTARQRSSLGAQQQLIHHFLDRHWDGPIEQVVISTCASGEQLDRRELSGIVEYVRSGRFDVLVCEDLSRIARDTEARHICGICVDCGVRVLAINDQLDTCDPTWRDSALFLAWRGEKFNDDLSGRIKGRLRERFNSGGALARPIAGYIVPQPSHPGQRWTEDDWAIDQDATPVIRECLRRTLDLHQPDWQIADWLNESGFSTGPHCQGDEWNGRRYRRWIANPLLAGLREHNRRHRIKRYEDGKRISVPAPAELTLQRRCTHLAHISVEDHRRLVRYFAARAQRYQRPGHGEGTLGRPKRRTRYPGQALTCGICARPFVFGAHGRKDYLMCGRSILAMPQFDALLKRAVNDAKEHVESSSAASLRQLRRDVQQAQSQIDNVLGFIRRGHDSPTVAEDLRRLEQAKDQMVADLQERQQSVRADLTIPPLAQLRSMFGETLPDLAQESLEFGEWLRRLIPKVQVFPYRLCDGGAMVMRARVSMPHSLSLSDRTSPNGGDDSEGQFIWIDLFDPPQREAFRRRVVTDRQNLSERGIAAKYGITQTAVQHAAALQRRMDHLGLDDPYVRITEPPDDMPKHRRHQHKRYRFDPLPGAGL